MARISNIFEYYYLFCPPAENRTCYCNSTPLYPTEGVAHCQMSFFHSGGWKIIKCDLKFVVVEWYANSASHSLQTALDLSTTSPPTDQNPKKRQTALFKWVGLTMTLSSVVELLSSPESISPVCFSGSRVFFLLIGFAGVSTVTEWRGQSLLPCCDTWLQLHKGQEK